MITECYYRDKGSDKYTYMRHSHDDCYEIIQVVSGTGSFLIGDILYPFSPGAMYLINTFDIHCSVPDNLDDYVRNKVIVNAARLLDFAESIGCSEVVERLFSTGCASKIDLTPERAGQADVFFSELFRANTAPPENNRKFEVYADLFRLLQFCYDNREYRKNAPHRPDTVSRALSCININIEDPRLSIDMIAHEIYSDKFYLCKQFKKRTNMTISEYVKYRRLSLAKKRLSFSDDAVASVAEQCGFSSVSYFCSLFRRETGMTPSQYRRQGTDARHDTV